MEYKMALCSTTSTMPKQLCSELADVCLSIHFFCFAETIDELRRMTHTILANLKPTGCCLIYACSLGSASEDEQMFQKDLEKFEEKLVLLDPPSSDRFKPRRYHTMMKGFHFNRHVKCMHTLIPLYNLIYHSHTNVSLYIHHSRSPHK